MTVGELVRELKMYPDDAEIHIGYEINNKAVIKEFNPNFMTLNGILSMDIGVVREPDDENDMTPLKQFMRLCELIKEKEFMAIPESIIKGE